MPEKKGTCKVPTHIFAAKAMQHKEKAETVDAVVLSRSKGSVRVAVTFETDVHPDDVKG